MLHSFRVFAADLVRSSGTLGRRTLVLTLFGALLEGIGLILLLPLVNVISGAGTGSGIIDRAAQSVITLLPAQSAAARLALLLAGFALLMVVRAAVIVGRDVSIARLQTGFVEELRLRVVHALADADWAVLTRLRHGRISHVLSNDIRSCGLAAQLSLQATVAAVLFAVQMVIALFLSAPIALFVFLLLGFGALLLRPALRRSRNLGVELTDASFRLTDDTNQFLGGLKLAFSQNLQGHFVAEFRRMLAFGASREVAFARQRTMGQVALTSLAAAVAGAALLLGFTVFRTSPTSLIALLVVLARMSGPAAQLQQNLQYIAHSLPAYEKILVLETELAAAGGGPRPELAATPAAIGGDLALTAASYLHGGGAGDSEEAGVRTVDLIVRPGEFVGIAGPSGAGKTTLVDLIVGLLPPQSGTVTVGGVRLEGATLRAWRDRISYVSQDAFLFHESISDNLLWARSGASEDDLRHVLGLAGASELIGKLPRGLGTVVGERGSLLSGGERQRIALARALIREPVLLVLDEATNAIDIAGERAILERLARLNPRPTIVMVAHREQSLALCERIVTLDHGRIVADELREERRVRGS